MATLPPRPKINAGPSRHVYDVIVLGGQIGGAMSAALLAKRGYRVLYVEHDGMGHGYEHGDFILPYTPFVAPPLRMMPVVDEALAELGLNTTVQRSLRPHVPDLQLVLSDHRMGGMSGVELVAKLRKARLPALRKLPVCLVADTIDDDLRGRVSQQVDFLGAYDLVRTGRVGVHVDRVYPLAEIAAAHERLEAGEQLGKIVLVMPGEGS